MALPIIIVSGEAFFLDRFSGTIAKGILVYDQSVPPVKHLLLNDIIIQLH